MEKTDLECVFNTRALILRDKSGQHFLHIFDGYARAPALGGPWTPADRVPPDVKKAENQAVKAKQVDRLAGQENPLDKSETVAEIHTPAHASCGDGADRANRPYRASRNGRPCLRRNCCTFLTLCPTRSNCLLIKRRIILISGRWFTSASFDGPWQFVPGAQLPMEFAAIPDDSPKIKKNVKASVPGTRQALRSRYSQWHSAHGQGGSQESDT